MNTDTFPVPYNTSGMRTIEEFRALLLSHKHSTRGRTDDECLARVEKRTEVALDISGQGVHIGNIDGGQWADLDAADIWVMESEYHRIIALGAVSFQADTFPSYHTAMSTRHRSLLTMAALADWKSSDADPCDSEPRANPLPHSDASRSHH